MLGPKLREKSLRFVHTTADDFCRISVMRSQIRRRSRPAFSCVPAGVLPGLKKSGDASRAHILKLADRRLRWFSADATGRVADADGIARETGSVDNKGVVSPSLTSRSELFIR